MPAVFLGSPGPVFHDPNQQTVHGNATVTSSGSNVFTGYGASQVSLFINVLASPTGGSPTLQYTIQEVDPGDGTTVIGATETSSVITGVTVERITLVSTFGGSIKVSWTVGGSSPSFTQVYATLVAKAGSVALVDADGLAIGGSNPLKIDPTGSTPQPVSGTLTVAVSGTPSFLLSGTPTVAVNQNNAGSHAQRWMMGLSDGAGFITPATDRTTAAAPFAFRLSDGAAFYDGAKTGQFPAALVSGRLDTNTGSWFGSAAPTVGQKAMASSIPIVISSDQSAIPVSGTVAVSSLGGTVDVSDRAGRLVGVVYGSQGQQLTQTATNFNLQVESAVGGTLIDPRAIRALTSSDVVTAAQGTAAAATAPWATRLSDGANFYDGTKTGQLPTALVGGRLDINTGTWFGSTAPTVGQKTSANSIPIVIASDQSAVPVSGTVTANNASIGTNAAAIPGSSTQVGGSDGTNLQVVRVFDADTGGGTQYVLGAVLRKSASGGSVEAGTASDPLRTDPTGTTIQPVSGTVTATQGTAAGAAAPWATRLSDGSAFYNTNTAGQLPAALVGGRLDANIGAWLGSTAPTVGQKTMANSIPIAFASDQSALPASQSGTWTVQQGTPPWSVVGPGAVGAAVTGNPVMAGGSDGTNARYISVDTTGRQVMVGAAADGATPAGNPVLMAGQDGTNVQSLKTDTTGRQEVIGGAADGATPAGNPVLIAGQDGTNVQSIKTDTDGRIELAPTGATAATKGFADGNVVLATTTVSAIRSTTYTEPSSGAQRSIASANAADTSAGTGARTVKITYFTLNAGTVAGPFTETVTLNGATPVNTVASDICYIEKLEVVTVGSGGVNAGIITLYGATAGGGGTVWTIAVGANKTFGAHHYVPSGMTASITGFLGGIKGADTSGFLLRAKDPTNANAAEIQISDLLRAPTSGQSFRTYGTPIEVVGPSRITAYAAPDSSSSRTYYASFDLYEQ